MLREERNLSSRNPLQLYADFGKIKNFGTFYNVLPAFAPDRALLDSILPVEDSLRSPFTPELCKIFFNCTHFTA